MGTSATAPPTWPDVPPGASLPRLGSCVGRGGRLDLRVLDQEPEGLGLAEREPEALELVAALQQASDGLGRAPGVLRPPRGPPAPARPPAAQASPGRDRRGQERAAHRALGVRPEVGGELLVIP